MRRQKRRDLKMCLRQRKKRGSGIKGQATAELAIFGSFVLTLLGFLLSYGLDFNYKQNLKMRAFRETLAEAYRHRKDIINVNRLVVESKPSIDPSDPFGVSEPVTQMESNSAAWSNYMFTSYSNKEAFETHNPYVLSRFTLHIGKKIYELTTAGYKRYYFNSRTEVRKKKMDYEDEHPKDTGGDGIFWYWKEVDLGDINGGSLYDIDVNGTEKRAERWEETAMKIFKDKHDKISGVGVMSDKEGEIIPVQDTNDIREGQPRAGFQSYMYDTKAPDNNYSLRKIEDKNKIKNITTINSDKKNYYYVRLNRVARYGGGYENIMQQVKKNKEDRIYVGDEFGIETGGLKDYPDVCEEEYECDARKLPGGLYLWLKIRTRDKQHKITSWTTPK